MLHLALWSHGAAEFTVAHLRFMRRLMWRDWRITWVSSWLMESTWFFSLAYREVVSQGNELLKKDFCLVAHRNRFLILASSVPPVAAIDAGSLPNVPVHQLTTFHVVELSSGNVTDRYTIENDCVDLTNNNGAYLYDDLLAILTIHGQDVHLLQLLPSGRFLVLHHLGRHCWDDDAMVISEQADAESRWCRSQGLAVENILAAAPSMALPSLEPEEPFAAPPAALQRAATEEELAELPAPEDVQQGAIAVLPILPEPAAGRPMLLPLLAQAGLTRGDSALLPPLEAPLTESQSIIEGIRHRILAYLFRERSAEGPGSGAVRRFFSHFQEYATLIIWKVQFLDSKRLLLSTGLRMASRSRSGSSYFLVVYDWHSGRVLSFMDSQSEKMLLHYLQLTPCFYGGGISSTWARHVTPCPSALWGPRDQSSLRAWIPSQAARRILAGIPTSSQAMSLSPYLDAHLFAYDERLITPALRLRTYNEQPLKFVSQRHPSICRFKVQPITTQNAAQTPGLPYYDVGCGRCLTTVNKTTEQPCTVYLQCHATLD